MMCLAVAAQVESRQGSEAVVSLQGSRLTISVVLVPQVEVGDWVLVHAGFAIQTMQGPTERQSLPVSN